MANIIISAPWSSLYGSKPAISEIFGTFGQFNYEQTFLRLSHAAYIFCAPDDVAHRGAINYYLSDATKRRLDIFVPTVKGQVRPFFRQQVLVAMKCIALCHAKKGGKSPEIDVERHEIGDALLMISDICLARETGTVTHDLINEPAPLNREFAVLMQIENSPHVRLQAARFFKMLFQYVPEALAGKKLSSTLWEDAFQYAYGCSLNDVFMLAYMVYVIYLGNRMGKYAGEHAWFDRDIFLTNLNWDQDRKGRTLDHLSTTWEDLPGRLVREQSLPFVSDFVVFQNKPLLVHGAGLQIIDPIFLMGMFGEQLLRQVKAAFAVRDQQDMYGSVLGEAFEKYMKWVMSQAYSNNTGVIDTIVHSEKPTKGDPDLVVSNSPVEMDMEFKGMLFSDHAVYGSDPQLFGLELYLKYAKSDGVKQLAAYINKQRQRRGIAQPGRVMPVIVALDRSLSAFAVQQTLHRAFNEYLTPAGSPQPANAAPMISRLTVLTAEEVERTVGFVRAGERFKDILDHIIAHDGNGMLPASELLKTDRWKTDMGYVDETHEVLKEQMSAMFKPDSSPDAETHDQP